ncbi:triphosphoribosyl-dephospho-CoA synthase CitG [Sedimentibacter saalensis]|uniref:Probable 2-(5''-triphosphoribosyl)-3'-dephosphocoenzyme-A synthase n=1 Tax=Sedimentibacter saalensis TaxID=130788 RepID=A0A562JCJ7_9FIRM|nr:triphosphoribosyl-dephospho-CoA synthase CitG [Sedimentibacter saalensis]TWH80584.1 triphosphoribosyl-dephospho-CoA synthase [Sedimentibacter saalensis]
MNKNIDKISFKFAEYAQRAILYEAVLTPKPGLVDAVNTGSHHDMDIFTFIDSSSNLFKGFYLYAKAGLECTGSEKELFSAIRKIGIQVEKDMFKATKNINTHKGINFSMGIVLAAAGYYLRDKDIDENIILAPSDTDEILNTVRVMTEGLVKSDFENIKKKEKLTHGERLYVEKGFSGIRGEAERGFPTVEKTSLPRLREIGHSDMSMEQKLLDVLFHLMSISDDSNIINRGGLEGLEFVKSVSKEFLMTGIIFEDGFREKIQEMNNLFVEKNISPGGSADLLSITIFFGMLESVFS